MNNKPVAWIEPDVIPLTHIIKAVVRREQDEQYSIPLYTHPVKELNEAIKIIKDFQSDDIPPCKAYEDTYADGWMDACNEILWAIEEKAQEK